MAAIAGKLVRSAKLLANFGKETSCHRLCITRSAHFTYVPDTPLVEYGIYCFKKFLFARSMLRLQLFMTLCLRNCLSVYKFLKKSVSGVVQQI
jgi:hypothetical protein